MIRDGNIPYEITIKTNDDANSGTSSPILLKINGDKSTSQVKMFHELGAKSGSTITTTITTIDVGIITGYKLILQDTGSWRPDFITIKNTSKIKLFN